MLFFLFFFASHSLFYIHPCCEDDSSQVWQIDHNVLQPPEQTAVGVILAALFRDTFRYQPEETRRPQVHPIMITISIALPGTTFTSPRCHPNSLNSKPCYDPVNQLLLIPTSPWFPFLSYTAIPLVVRVGCSGRKRLHQGERQALGCLCWLTNGRLMEAVSRRDGFPRPSCLHPFIVHELRLPDSCLYLPPLTDACRQSVWEGLRSASSMCWPNLKWTKGADGWEMGYIPCLRCLAVCWICGMKWSPTEGAGASIDCI